jgi:hypothetical protein
MRLATPAAVSALFGLAACASSGPNYGTGNTGKRGSATNGAGPSSTTGGSTVTTGTTGVSTSTGSSSGSTTGGVDCGDAFLANWYDGGYADFACPPGQLNIAGRLTSVCDALAPITGAFTAGDAFNPTINGSTMPCGVFSYCVDPGTQLTPEFVVPGFATTVMATLNVVSDAGLGLTAHNGLALICNAVVDGLPSQQLSPPFDPSLSILYLHVTTLGIGTACDTPSGWSFAASQLDGGLIDAGAFFISGSAAVQTDGGTVGNGVEILYDIDPALGSVLIAATGARLDGGQPLFLSDGGLECPNQGPIAPYEFTGLVPLLSGNDEMTFFPYAVE